MLVHGLKDENVHFCHTSLLIDQLQLFGKGYELLVFPQERHGLRKWDSYVYAETRVFRFFLNVLLED